MIIAINEKHLNAFLKIRGDALRLEPLSFSADTPAVFDREQTYRDLQNKNEENFILLAFVDEQVAGLLGFVRHSKIKLKHKAFIWGVFVYPEFRGQGIGQALLQEAISRAKKINGLLKVDLTVTTASTKALPLYEKMGFVVYGKEPNALFWEGEYVDEIYLSKTL